VPETKKATATYQDAIYLYTIPKGETLLRISGRFHWPVDSIKILNNLKSDLILTGRTLKIKMKVIMKITAAGQTIDSIALKTNTGKQSILDANGWSSEPELRQGDVVLIPF
jgi:LysM repeat protein